MNAVWIFIKLFFIVGLSVFLATTDGWMTLVWGGYQIDMSVTILGVIIIFSVYIIWKTARVLDWAVYVPKLFLNTRTLNKKVDGVDDIISALQSLSMGNKIKFKKNIKSLELSFGKKHRVVKFLTAKSYEKVSSIVEMKNLLGSEINDSAEQSLLQLNDSATLDELIAENIRSDSLSDWGYIYLSNKETNFTSSVAQLDIGKKIAGIDNDTYEVELAVLKAKFNEKDAIAELASAWKKASISEHLILRIFEGFDYFEKITAKQFKLVEKILPKHNGMANLVLAKLSIHLELWAVANDYAEKGRSNGANDKYTNTVLANIEYAENGATERCVLLLKQAIKTIK